MIEISAKAVKQLKKYLADQDLSDHGVRIGVRGSGRCALEYYMGIQKHPLPEDNILIRDGLSFYMDVFSENHMINIQLDFNPEIASGFLFRNLSDPEKTGCQNCSF
jgi:iron-sulfur cluster assembly accessory protein